MSFFKRKWKRCEDEWVSFDKTKVFKELNKRNNEEAVNSEGSRIMNMEVHNQLDINHDKTISTISFFANTVLGKFARKKKWKVEVWLDERKSKTDPNISCGVALIRPNKGTLYAKKISTNLSSAVKQSFSIIEKSIKNENKRWAKA